jgi:hypothetical protein|tara:strand:- start:392 stop:874 length:483 start_codon:yes stop_codon:yes gene_type:complete
MDNNITDKWFTGSGSPISAEAIFDEIDEYVKLGGKVFIGTDSQIKSGGCIFVTAICLHSRSGKKYGKYFFNKGIESGIPLKALRVRIMKEVQLSIDIAFVILEQHPQADIEVHVDIGTTQRSATRKFVDSISGWVKGAGLECKIKPNSWASSSVADNHTK